MKIEKVYLAVSDFFRSFLNKEGEIIDVTKEKEQWNVIVEVLEDTEYTRAHAKRDLKGIYEIKIDENLEIFSFGKKKVIERGVPYQEESDY